MPKKKSADTADHGSQTRESWMNPRVFLGVLVVLVVISFSPLLKYFLAQDDFTLLLKAYSSGTGTLAEYFSATPGQFRPLTKVVYFGAMYGVFGLNAAAYHVVSLLFHLVNTLLVFMLFRKLRIGMLAALAATTLFGLSVIFMHVLAWASCIQQLMAQTFMLLTILFGIGGLADNSARLRAMSLAAYVLGLLSMEQTFAAPLILALYAYFDPADTGKRMAPGDIVRRLTPHFAVMIVYAMFMILWKTLPQAGPYETAYAFNIVLNLLKYVGWVYQFAPVLASTMNITRLELSASHIFFMIVIGYLVILGRFKKIIFGFSYFVLALLPVLILKDHTFYLHVYVPAFGMLYLLAVIIDDIDRLPLLARRHARPALLALFMIVVFVFSFVKLRANERDKMQSYSAFSRSFVLRRALIAGTMYKDIMKMESTPEQIRRVYLVYGREEGRDAAQWNIKNVAEALGRGDAIRLFYDDPDLEVHFRIVGDKLTDDEMEAARIYFYNDFGDCFAFVDTVRSENPTN